MILTKLDDLQLAIVIARLYESELDDAMPTNMKRLLLEDCLGCDQSAECYDPASAHPDPFIRSMAYWLIKDYSAALGTLLETNIGSSKRKDNVDDTMDTYSSNPSVFNFYNYLRTHPLLVRQHLANTAADKSQTVLLSGFTHGAHVSSGDKNVTYVDRITPVERRLYFTTAHMHFKNGCPMLALEVLSKLPETIDMDSDITKSRSGDSFCGSSQIVTGKLGDDSNINTKTEASSGIDWSQPVSSKLQQNAGSIDWGQPVKMQQTADAFDWSTPSTKSSNATAGGIDWGAPVTKFEDEELDLTLDLDDHDTKSDSEVESKDKLLKSISQEGREEEDITAGHEKSNGGVGDIMSQQLKFIACLKIMMEELATLATGFEVDGGQLRFQLYIWLEREVEVLKKICKYGLDIINAGSGQVKKGLSTMQICLTFLTFGVFLCSVQFHVLSFQEYMSLKFPFM